MEDENKGEMQRAVENDEMETLHENTVHDCDCFCFDHEPGWKTNFSADQLDGYKRTIEHFKDRKIEIKYPAMLDGKPNFDDFALVSNDFPEDFWFQSEIIDEKIFPHLFIEKSVYGIRIRNEGFRFSLNNYERDDGPDATGKYLRLTKHEAWRLYARLNEHFSDMKNRG